MVYIAPHISKRTHRKFDDKPEHCFAHFIGYAVPDILKSIGLTKSGIYNVGKIDVLSDAFQKMFIKSIGVSATLYRQNKKQQAAMYS